MVNAAVLILYVAQGENGPLVEELRLQLAVKEKELQVMKDGAEELKLLQQQNYVLQSKVPNVIMCPILNSAPIAFNLFFVHFIIVLNLSV